MIRTKTVFILGAGAGTELQFPSGQELLDKVASGFDFFRFGPEPQTKDSVVLLRYLAKLAERPGQTQDAIYAATERLRTAARLGRSIDTIIEQVGDEPLNALVGKIAVAHQICTAEAKSNLKPTPRTEGDLPVGMGDFWLVEFARLLTGGVPRSRIDRAFDDFAIINFNYDRSVEHFLPWVLVTAYGMDLKDAQRLISQRLQIHHPYGAIGRLPWQIGDTPDHAWGNEAPWNMLNIAQGLRTCSEAMAQPQVLNAMRKAVGNAQRIVFLGFGYHPQNLDLLIDGSLSHNPEILASIHGVSKQNLPVALRQIKRKTGNEREDRLMLAHTRCFETMRDYSMLLES